MSGQRQSGCRRAGIFQQRGRAALAAACLCCFSAATHAQDPAPPAAPVKYTEAVARPVEQLVKLPGYVEAPYVSMLAGETAGLVVALEAREGDRVTQGQPLVRLRTTALELRLKAAQARLKEAQARKNLAEKRLERSRQLIEENTISQQVMDEAQYEFAAWQWNIESLRAEIAGIRFDLERSVIHAPFNGVVVARHTEVGQWSGVGDEALEILSTETLEVHVDVPEKYFGDLAPGAAAAVAFDSLPGKEYAATIRAVVPRADPQARTFPVKLRLENPGAGIGAGMLARAAFPLRRAASGVLVPKDAVVQQGGNDLVYLVGEDSTAVAAPVTTTAAMGVWSVVEGDIAPGARVITRGNERLRPGQPVRGEPLSYPLP